MRIFFLVWFAAKFDVHPSGCLELVKHVSMACPNLEFCGLMTIGMPDYTSTPENFKVVFLLIYISFGSVVLSCSLLVNLFLRFLMLLKFPDTISVLVSDVSEL